MIDYTGSSTFGQWLRDNARQAQLFTEETGVNSVVIAATNDLDGMRANRAFALSIYSGQMCTSPQNLYIPAGGIETGKGHKSFDEVATALVAAIDSLLEDPARAAGICGAIANPATQARAEATAAKGRVLRAGASKGEPGPLFVAVGPVDTTATEECFGPVAFLIATRDGDAAIQQAAALASEKGAITAALYDTDEARIARA